MATVRGVWDEALHPRGAGGKFTRGSHNNLGKTVRHLSSEGESYRVGRSTRHRVRESANDETRYEHRVAGAYFGTTHQRAAATAARSRKALLDRQVADLQSGRTRLPIHSPRDMAKHGSHWPAQIAARKQVNRTGKRAGGDLHQTHTNTTRIPVVRFAKGR